MVLSHEDYQASESDIAQGKATAIIQAFEKLEREQRVEVKRDLLTEIATKADIANLKLRLEKRLTKLETLMKVIIALLFVGMGFFSPVTAEIIKFLR